MLKQQMVVGEGVLWPLALTFLELRGWLEVNDSTQYWDVWLQLATNIPNQFYSSLP